MYCTSTQKRECTFSAEQLRAKREMSNAAFRESKADVVQEVERETFLTVDEEILMLRIVEHAAIKFSDSFQPPMWASVKWTAYMYFKRLYLKWSVMDFSPKVVMMACFYVAMKTDEFYVTIEDFVKNLKSGTAEQNTRRILGLEAEVLKALNYQLLVHCPYRPFEGHLVEMKSKILLLNFDLEIVRQPAEQFFRKCLTCDVMLMYAPSQIAMAAIKHGLDWLGKDPSVLRDFVLSLLGVDNSSVWRADTSDAKAKADKLLLRLDEIIDVVNGEIEPTGEMQAQLQHRTCNWTKLSEVLEQRKGPSTRRAEEPVDSDDE